MKKRIVCAWLALIMLVSLVPATAITAAAATNSVSESVITVLKSLEKYDRYCDENGYIGYGTKCTGEGAHDGAHEMYEKDADTALRKVLADLSTAVNNFAGKYGLGLSQAQHDALVLFSFENGTAWTTGTGDFQTAIRNRSTGTEFLDAICKWNYGTGDDVRRMIEANMYLNGVYNTTAPSRFIWVELDVGDGSMREDSLQYFDVLSTTTIDINPTPNDAKATFLGWYFTNADGNLERVNKLTKDHNGLTLVAQYQGESDTETASSYTIKKSDLASTTVYHKPNGEKKTKYVNHLDKEVSIKLADELNVIADYVDTKGVHWAKIADIVEVDGVEKVCFIGWVKVKAAPAGGTDDAGASADLLVTVTNTYVNMRKKASIYSDKVGTRNMGAQLRILKVKSADGFVWGQVATSPSDATPVGWVALMYTDYETVKNNASGSSTNKPVVSGTVVARATITYNGYVNVRSDAGTQNPIVGSLAYGTTVDVYETTYVNGIKWGRCSSGWFCMTTYAKVETLIDDTNTSNAGFASYAISITLVTDAEGKVFASDVFFTAPGGTDAVKDLEKDGEAQPMASKTVVVSNLVNKDGNTWGKSEYGWIELFDADGYLTNTNVASVDKLKFNIIADNVTVRNAPSNGGERLDVLIKGVELVVDRIVVDHTGSTIWGHADKIGETVPTYNGWVNLATKNVSRIGAPTVPGGSTGSTSGGTTAAAGTVATVINTETVRVRKAASVTATQIGSLRNGSTYAVLAEKNGWYKLDVDVDSDPKTDSWVYGQYLDVKKNTAGSTTGAPSGKVETGMGIVANTYTGVNIRTAPGTGNAAVGKYLPGTTVEILEVTTYGASKWGRTDKGWVCMDYIAMVSNYLPNGSTGSTGSTGGTGSTVVDSNVAIYTGYADGSVDVYKEPSLKSEVIRTIDGTAITLHEILTVVEKENEVIEDESTDDNQGATTVTKTITSYWARVNDGYIYSPGENLILDALDEEKYTLAAAVEDVVNLSSKIGDATFDLNKGEQVTITKLQIEKNYVLGYVECNKGEGWVQMTKMTKGFASTVAPEDDDEEETTAPESGATTTPPVIGSTGNTSTGGYVNNAGGYKYTGKVINTNQVNVRASASTAAGITTTLKNGAALVIYETVIAENMAWGRCDAGWVYLYYVDLTPAGNGAVDARVVYNDNTIIYTDMNCSGVAGSYARMSVVDIYEIVGKMARTDLGWVHVDNML